MMLLFLGTNGWFSTSLGNTAGVMIKDGNRYLFLDVGDGLWKSRNFDVKEMVIFITHTHLDHIIGLHQLLLFKPKRIEIYCPRDQRVVIKNIMNRDVTEEKECICNDFEIYGVEAWDEFNVNGFKVSTAELKHKIYTIAYRIERGKSISYCTDTAYTDSAVELSKKANVLIHECFLKSGEKKDDWPHSSPETAAEVARKAKVKHLFLFHFDPLRYKNIESRLNAERNIKRIFKRSMASMDRMEIEI